MSRLAVCRVLFVMLTVVLDLLDVDSAFTDQFDPIAVAVAVALCAAWLATYLRLCVLLWGRRAVA